MSTITVTGKVGPGFQLTAVPIPMKEFTIKCDQESLYILTPEDRFIDVDISTATTITVTVTGNNYTVVVS